MDSSNAPKLHQHNSNIADKTRCPCQHNSNHPFTIPHRLIGRRCARAFVVYHMSCSWTGSRTTRPWRRRRRRPSCVRRVHWRWHNNSRRLTRTTIHCCARYARIVVVDCTMAFIRVRGKTILLQTPIFSALVIFQIVGKPNFHGKPIMN